MSIDVTKIFSGSGQKQIEGNYGIYGGNNTDKNIILSKLNATPFVDIVLGILGEKSLNELGKKSNNYIENREKKLEELVKSKRNEISKKISRILTEHIPSEQKEVIENHILSIIEEDIIENKLNSEIPNIIKKCDIKKAISDIEDSSKNNSDTFLRDYYSQFIEPHNAEKVKNRWTISDFIKELGGIEEYSDSAIVCGKIEVNGLKYGVIGHNKQFRGGRASTEDHIRAINYVKECEEKKFPIVFWIDTPGSESGKKANEDHQARIMSTLISKVGDLKVPSMSILAGEGGSGGAQVFMGSDKVYSLKGSYFATIHPKGQEGILRGQYNAKELAWIQKMDVYNLMKKGVIDDIIDISPVKNENNTKKKFSDTIKKVISKHFEVNRELLNQYKISLKKSKNKEIRKLLEQLNINPKKENQLIEEKIENLIRNEIKKARLFRASTRMITPRNKENQKTLKEQLSTANKYEQSLISNEFKNYILSSESIKAFNENDFRLEIMKFFEKKFQDTTFHKFNINSYIELLGTSVLSIKKELENDTSLKHNNIIGSLRQELRSIKTFFDIIGEIINPKNYNDFFAKEEIEIQQGTGEKIWKVITLALEKIENSKGLEYKKEDVEKLLSKIYENIDIDTIDISEKEWRIQRFGWIKDILDNKKGVLWFQSILKSYKTAHYDLPNVVNEMTGLLLEKFVQYINNPTKYKSELQGNDIFKIDYGEKARYETLLFFNKIKKLCIGRITPDMVISEYLKSFNQEYLYNREQVSILEEKKGIFTPKSSAQVGFGRLNKLQREKGIVIIDTSVDFGAIDGSIASAIINLIKETATKERSVVIIIIGSAGMNVNAGPEAVSSMSAINKAISDFYEKTNGKKNIVVYSLGNTLGGTAAGFAQDPRVIHKCASTSEVAIAGRIVNPELINLEATIADLQLKSNTKPYGIDGLVKHPFIDDAEEAYDIFQKGGINIKEPRLDFIQSLVESGIFEKTDITYTKPTPQAFTSIEEPFKKNKKIFKPYKKVAIFNRGVIANKAQKALKKLGVKCIQFYTDSDAEQNYVKNPKVDSVWLSDYVKDPLAILQAIKDNGCDSIYLGYGFFSENADFIKECEKRNIVVIGPNSKNVYQMGDKLTARITSKKVLNKLGIDKEKYGPAKGSDDVFEELKKESESYKLDEKWIKSDEGEKIVDEDGLLHSKEAALVVADKIGLPVMLKARFGGGGKGIKFIRTPEDITENFDRLSSEAKASFGNGNMYLEKAMENQMHIEVQVFADSEGNAVTMGLRNCSAQRRGQKLIEECGKLNIDENIIKQLESFVRETTKEIRYVGAGTFEFLYDPEKKKFTFMEMNTRIQVEHTITETQLKEAGVKAKRMKELNLVELQARLAMGENGILPKQKDIDKAFEKGYTTEIRLCAEDPMNNFTGVQMAKIKNLKIFKEPVKGIHSVHFESFLKEGKETGGNTGRGDSMIGQLIVSGKDRQTVSRYLKVALKKMNIEGIPVNKDFLVNVIESAEYKEGNFRINTIDKDMEGEKKFFKGLKKFNGDIESVIDADEDFIHLKNDEYIVRTSRDFTFYTKPSEDESAFITEGDEFKIDGEKPFYTQGVNKVFSDINSLEGTYIKNYQGKETPLKELGEIKITEVVVPENGTQVRIGNGLFIVKKA